MNKFTHDFNVSDGLQLSEDVVDGHIGSGHGRIEFVSESDNNASTSDHARRTHSKLVLESAKGNVTMCSPSNGTPRIGDI